MVSTETTAAMMEELSRAGLVVDGIVFGGELHRCGTVDKPNGKDGSYIAHADAPASLWWQNFPAGTSDTWTAKSDKPLSTNEKKALQARIKADKAKRESERTRRNEEAASKAQGIYSAAVDCVSHPYLERKGVQPVPGLKVSTDPKCASLIVPVRNESNKLVGLQFIHEDGSKKFLTGTAKKGGFFIIGGRDTDKPLLICEGLATGLSLYEAVGFPALVSFDAGNLLPVAEMARGKYPDRDIVLCADYDNPSDGYPAPGGIGLAKATEAAVAVGGSLAVPRYNGNKVDFNDLHQKMGAGEVLTQFMTHRKPEPATIKDALPYGFEIRTKGNRPGLWYTECKTEGDPESYWIGEPIHVLGETRDEDSNSWGKLLQWEDRDGKLHTWAMPNELLVGKDSSAWLGRLVSEGWTGSPNTKARNKLALFLTSYKTDRRARCVDRTGWHSGVFVLPDETIKSFPTTEIVSDVSDVSDEAYSRNNLKASDIAYCLSDVSDGERIVLQVRTAHNPFRMAGTLDGWQSSIGTWARGNSRVMLAICASLAASLLEMSGQESGGFNFIGGTSTGKTTALVAAGSTWGKGSSSGGYVQNWRATDNGLEGIAALHSDAALCLDEIGQAPGRTIKEASYMLANGMGKARASADGSSRAVKTWRIMLLSTGEKGLADKITEEGGKVHAGQLVRLVDVPADAGAGFGIFENLHGHETARAFSDAIKQAAATHYGHAARAFIAAFLNSEEAKTEIPLFLAQGLELICPKDAPGQVQRVAKRFLLCAAAGEAAVRWGLLPWERNEALAAVKACFDAWVAFRGGIEPAEDTAILGQVHLFIEQHGTSRFQDIDNPAATCINRVGFRRKVDNDIEFMILPESFKAEVCKGLNAKRAATLLYEHGLLVPGEGRNMMRRSPCELPGFGRKRCYTLLMKGEVFHAAG